MKTAIILSAFLFIPVLAFSATIHVPGDYPTIQEAIDASVHGDTVLVAAGTYVENIDFLGKAITVTSSHGPEHTIIDGSNTPDPEAGSVVTFMNGEESSSALDGFTLTRGTGTKYTTPVGQKFIAGGGIFCQEASPSIANIIFTLNAAEEGGGMMTFNSSPLIKDCIFHKNRTSDFSGGAFMNYYGNPTLVDCLFSENKSRSYGGAFQGIAGTSTLIRCFFVDNRADGYGGAVYNPFNDLTLINCVFLGNDAGWGYGGGANIAHSATNIIGCVFIENTTGKGGGGLHFTGEDTLSMTNCTFYENTAGDVGGAVLIGNEVTANISNSILWYNHAPEGSQLYISGWTWVEIRYSDVYGGLPGVVVKSPASLEWKAGMIDADPRFADPAKNDIHLTYPSPCRDTGDNTAVMEPYDFEGDPRIAWGGTVDMGADEFYTHLYVTGDETPGGSIQGKLVGLPGTSPTGFFLGSGVLEPPLPTAWGNFHLQAPWFLIPLVPIPGDGVLVLPATIPTTPPAPYDLPMQALIGLQSDSLTNVEVLEVR
jgi:predicted outer membrane repeat protein